jgi:hypothetical protein
MQHTVYARHTLQEQHAQSHGYQAALQTNIQT